MGLKKALKEAYVKAATALHNRRVIRQWVKHGRPYPPPHEFKQRVVAAYGRQYGLDTLIETGTFRGQMVAAQRRNFRRIISLELSEELYERAKELFAEYPLIEILKGDSTELLPQIVADINKAALFWLDGPPESTKKGKPVMQELKTILSRGIDHVVLIDDARLFNGTDDYPALNELRKYVISLRADYNFEIADDIIRLYK